MKLKFVGRDTRGKTVAKMTVQGNHPMFKLYQGLVATRVISIVDYDPYTRVSVEKAGINYEELERRYGENDKDEEVIEILNNLPDLTEEEICILISEEDGNAYYQEYYIFIDNEPFEVDFFDFDNEIIYIDVDKNEEVLNTGLTYVNFDKTDK